MQSKAVAAEFIWGIREEREGERERRDCVYLADVSGRAGAHAVGGARNLAVALRDGDERRAAIAPYPRLRTTTARVRVREDAKKGDGGIV